MAEIVIERNLSDGRVEALNVSSWPVWTKSVSEFPWSYDEPETCYFIEGEVVVTPVGGEPVHMKAGDYVVFPRGLKCTWKILANVKKHYQFG